MPWQSTRATLAELVEDLCRGAAMTRDRRGPGLRQRLVQRATLLLGQVVSFILGNDVHTGIVWHAVTSRVPPGRGKQSGCLPQLVNPPEPLDDRSRYEMDGLLKKHGVFFDLTLEDVQKDSDAALRASR